MQTCSRAQGLEVKDGERSVCYFSCSCIHTTDRRNLREDCLAHSSICYSGEGMATMKERACDLVFLMMSDQKAEYLDRH